MSRQKFFWGVMALIVLLASSAGVAQDQAAQPEDYLREALEAAGVSDFQRAINLLEHGIALATNFGDEEKRKDLLHFQGTFYRLQGIALARQDLPHALEAFKVAQAIFEELKQSWDVGLTYNYLGTIWWREEEFSQALDAHEKALQIFRDIGARFYEGTTLTSRVNVLADMGVYAEALEEAGQALEIFRDPRCQQWEKEDVPPGGLGVGSSCLQQRGFVLDNVSEVFVEMGNLQSARQCVEGAREIFRDANDLHSEAYALGNLAALDLQESKYAEARKKFEEVKKIFEQLPQQTTPAEIRQTESWIGRTHLALGQLPQAFSIFERQNFPFDLGAYYLRIHAYERSLHEFNRMVELRGDIRPHIRIPSYIGKGQAQEGLKDDAAAHASYKTAVEMIEEQRGTLSRAQRQAFFAGGQWLISRVEAYEGLVRTAFRLSQFEDSFLDAERAKARAFLDAIAHRYNTGTLNLPHRPPSVEQIPLRNDELLLVYEVTATETLVWLLEKGRLLKVIPISITRDELGKKVQTYTNAFQDIARRKSPSAFQEYKPELGAELYELLIPPVLRPLLSQDKKLIIVPDEMLGILPFETLVTALPPKVEWVRGECPYPSGVVYLGDTYSVSYYQSATALSTMRGLKSDTGTKPLFLLADPVFSRDDPRVSSPAYRESAAKSASASMSVAPPCVSPTIQGEGAKTMRYEGEKANGRLEETRRLAETLPSLFNGQGEILIDFQATKENLKSASLQDYRYCVLATHGDLGGGPSRRQPALALTPPELGEKPNLVSRFLSQLWQWLKNLLVFLGIIRNAPPIEDWVQYILSDENISADSKNPTQSHLTMSEVMDMQVGCEVVALIACNTGRGEVLAGEGVMGMGRAFQYAGAKSVLMSLWTVNEDSTVLLTQQFFRHLIEQKGKDKVKALQLARRDVRKAGYEHPYFWAPFILVGER